MLSLSLLALIGWIGSLAGSRLLTAGSGTVAGIGVGLAAGIGTGLGAAAVGAAGLGAEAVGMAGAAAGAADCAAVGGAGAASGGIVRGNTAPRLVSGLLLRNIGVSSLKP
ncbi:MAG: hypothetical protein NTX50_24395 [Candidatus Sumerlaeota bacterium]|nr:hypothetical protein [Candidatus Sumerlaeota bacterium]